jgi:hypothetical protein
MPRFSLAVVVVLAFVGVTTIAISPASALSGTAYDKCMTKCMKNAPKGNRCPYWCENNNR